MLNVDRQTIVNHLHFGLVGHTTIILRTSLLLRSHLTVVIVVDADGLTDKGVVLFLFLLLLRTELFGCPVRDDRDLTDCRVGTSNSLLSHLLSLSEILGQLRLVARVACLVEA